MTSPSAPSGYDVKQVQTFTPEMMDLYRFLLGAAGGEGLQAGLQHLGGLAGGDESAFAQMEAPYYAALEKGLGQTASRFSQFGARGSSAFEQAAAGQSQNLAQELGAQRNQTQMNALQMLLGLGTKLLGQKPTETFLEPGLDFSALGAAGIQALPALLKLLA